MLLPQYTGIVMWDFEFRPDADHRQSPVCATFLELRSGKRVEMWGEFGAHPPLPDYRRLAVGQLPRLG
jgi:hypothetical protein